MDCQPPLLLWQGAHHWDITRPVLLLHSHSASKVQLGEWGKWEQWPLTVSLDRVMGFATAPTGRRVKTSPSKQRDRRKKWRRGRGKRKERLMDSWTCWGWNQLKCIKSRIHAFSKWQMRVGNWERLRENNVFDLAETGCSFRQGSQKWSEMRSW